jgi:hypothetical protein
LPEDEQSRAIVPVQGTTDTIKWTTWTDSEVITDWPTVNDNVFEAALPKRSAERLLRGVAWAVAGLVVLTLIVSLLSFGVARWRQRAPKSNAIPAIPAQKRVAWQKVMAQKAFQLARSQAKAQGRSLSANEKQLAAQKAVLQTVNAGGPDYANFAAAKSAGVVNSTLWNLAFDGAVRGGTLPPVVHQASVAKSRAVPRRRIRVARTSRRRTPEKQAVILGRGPVREDTNSIIVIRD